MENGGMAMERSRSFLVIFFILGTLFQVSFAAQKDSPIAFKEPSDCQSYGTFYSVAPTVIPFSVVTNNMLQIILHSQGSYQTASGQISYAINQPGTDGKSGLMWAVICGRSTLIQTYFVKNQLIDINQQDNSGKTALMYAVMYNNFTALQHLFFYNPSLNKKAKQKPPIPLKPLDVNILDKEGKNAFYLAIENKVSASILEALMDKKVKTDIVTKSGMTPAMAAIQVGNQEGLNFLFLNESSSFTQDKINKLLLWAVQVGNIPAIQILVGQHKAQIDVIESKYGMTPIMWASYAGQVEALKLLLQYTKNNTSVINKVSKAGKTALVYAAQYVESDKLSVVLTMLLKAGATLNVENSNNNSALLFLTKRSQGKTVEEILDKKVDPPIVHHFTETATKEILDSRFQAIIIQLLSLGAQIDSTILTVIKDDLSPDQVAKINEEHAGLDKQIKVLSEKGDVLKAQIVTLNTQVAMLEDQKKPINQRGNELSLKLAQKMHPGGILITNRMKELGALLFNAIKAKKETEALLYINQIKKVSQKSMDSIIFQKNIQPATYFVQSMTPLLLAARNDMLSVVKELVAMGVPLEGRGLGLQIGGTQFSALLWAGYNANLEMIKILIKAGAKVTPEFKEDMNRLRSLYPVKGYGPILEYLSTVPTE
jgi:ankyrin repeat protein